MISILSFIFTISILIIFHECGHYYAAKKLGFKVEEFSVGFGKKLLSFKDSAGTLWVIRLILMGGFVKIDFAKSNPDNSYSRKNILKEIIVAFGGPLANYILAIVILWIIYLYQGRYDFWDYLGFFKLLIYSFLHAALDVSLFAYLAFKSFVTMLLGMASLDNIGGIITIANHSASALDYGIITYLKFLAVLSINLGVVNLLPIPMLDGGRILLLSYELSAGKPLNLMFKEKLYKVGACILLFLVVISVSNDINSLLY